LQKKHRRTSSGEPKQGRKSKSGGEEKAKKRKLKTLPEGSAEKEVKEVIFDEAGRWESALHQNPFFSTGLEHSLLVETALSTRVVWVSLEWNLHNVRQ
jgi:hypothetical protein